MGNLLAVVVHAANIHDTKARILAAKKAFEAYPSIQRFCADAGYHKTFEQDVSSELGLGRYSVRIKPEWEVLSKRWIVERPLAWIDNLAVISTVTYQCTRTTRANRESRDLPALSICPTAYFGRHISHSLLHPVVIFQQFLFQLGRNFLHSLNQERYQIFLISTHKTDAF